MLYNIKRYRIMRICVKLYKIVLERAEILVMFTMV